MSAGAPAHLDIRSAGTASIRITLRPLDAPESLLATPALAAKRFYPAPTISIRTLTAPLRRKVGALTVEVTPNPLTVTTTNQRGVRVQQLVFEQDGTLSFALDSMPLLGMGEGGPRPDQGKPWREQSVQFDRRGRRDNMEPRWQSDMYGSRNPVPMFVGTSGWAMFVVTPWVEVDLTKPDRGVLTVWSPSDSAIAPQTQRNQGRNLNKGRPPVDRLRQGLFDVFVFDAHDPAVMLQDYSSITGPAVLPPKWALGYMQSHRTLEDETQLLNIVDTFRAKRIPVDAVIYLGTGFTPRGWNTTQPSFAFNPEVFKREGKDVVADIHARHVKVVVHMVPWDRDRLPTLHGSIPPAAGEPLDASHIATYWQQHVGLFDAGIDAFWPDEGDWFNLFERIVRHRLYYEGPLSSRPNVRPWSLHRNGFPGIAQWGGWVWSGDTESSWKTLEAQIAVGLNHSLSISPFWGTDIGGFYASRDLTGELYARWFQFAAFTPSFRAHGRTWWTRLPWGWGLSEMGPREGNNTNTAGAADERGVQMSALNNPAIEPIARRYDELRYRLLPYNYTLSWEAREKGLPLMRAMWVHYPNDARGRGLGSQYLWGRDLLVAPVFQSGATQRDVYLPSGVWYDWWSGEKLEGGRSVARPVDLATMPIYARAGAIIPLDPVRQYTSEVVTEPTEIRVYPGANGSFVLYDDDGVTQAYLQGAATYTRFTWNDRTRVLMIEPGQASPIRRATRVGSVPAGPRQFNVVLGPSGRGRLTSYSGRRVQVAF